MNLVQASLHTCVGVVFNPSKGVLLGSQPFWCCHLLISQVGKSACSPSDALISQEKLFLRCRGANVVGFCASSLHHGDVVHTIAKLFHKPKYSAENSMYFYDSELFITDSFGHIALIKRMK